MRPLLVFTIAFSCLTSVAGAAQPVPVEAVVYFSPDGGAQDAIVAEVEKAKTSVRVQAYSFTNPRIAKSLSDAKARGVDVVVILDKSQLTQKYSSVTYLTNQGVPTYVDSKHAIAHNKVMIIDGQTVITGSYNFTNAAEHKNAENLLILKSGSLADAYLANWQVHLKHSIQ